MPTIYLAPTIRDSKGYICGGSEEERMIRLADAMVPYLDASGIQTVRGGSSKTASASEVRPRWGGFDLYLTLHLSQAPRNLAGKLRGIQVVFDPGSAAGQKAARIIAANLRSIYPLPAQVRVDGTSEDGETLLERPPWVFAGLGYCDNPDDAAWIAGSLEFIAQNLVFSLTQHFQVPFLMPVPPRSAAVDVCACYLNIRSRPVPGAPVVARAYDGARLDVINEYEGWYLVGFGNVMGYVSGDFVTLV